MYISTFKCAQIEAAILSIANLKDKSSFDTKIAELEARILELLALHSQTDEELTSATAVYQTDSNYENVEILTSND